MPEPIPTPMTAFVLTGHATCENMIPRARVAAGDQVLIAGASEGVGPAAIR